jgi:hypothetical protein
VELKTGTHYQIKSKVVIIKIVSKLISTIKNPNFSNSM